MKVKHGRLQLGQLDRRDSDRPDVAQLVVAAVLLHCCYFWSHPAQRRVQRGRRGGCFFHTDDRFTLSKADENVPFWLTHQYGVPIKDFLLAIVAVILAATPKSAGTKSDRIVFFVFFSRM